MNNEDHISSVNLREVSLDEIEERTGLHLWGNVASDKFNERRDSINNDDWWMKGQPNV